MITTVEFQINNRETYISLHSKDYEIMDFCVDCNHTLQDLFCRRCKMIFVYAVEEGMACRNCSRDMIQRGSQFRYRCNFCQHRYFAYQNYDPSYKEAMDEYIGSLERECPDCKSRMLVNPANQELVCNTCGLVYEDPIYTKL